MIRRNFEGHSGECLSITLVERLHWRLIISWNCTKTECQGQEELLEQASQMESEKTENQRELELLYQVSQALGLC